MRLPRLLGNDLRRVWLSAVVGLMLTGCDARFPNSEVVYPPVSGFVEVRWKLSTPGIQRVEYSVNDQPVGSSSDQSAFFSVQVDTTKLPNGLHTLKVVAQGKNNQPLRIIQHTLLVQN